MNSLRGKIALITGGASGIGFSTVKELLRNGVKGVAVADINTDNGDKAVKEISQQFGKNKAIFVKTDVTKIEQLEAAFKQTTKTWNSVDIVINNAGIMNDGQWELEIALNCNAVVHGTLLGLKYMGKDQGGNGGIIASVSSIAGLQPVPFIPIYVGTKYFVIGLCRSFAKDYHYTRTGVKILALCPGPADTNLIPEAVRLPLNITSNVGQDFANSLAAATLQTSETVAKGMVRMLAKGENGGVWVAENNELAYELQIPDRRTFDRTQTT